MPHGAATHPPSPTLSPPSLFPPFVRHARVTQTRSPVSPQPVNCDACLMAQSCIKCCRYCGHIRCCSTSGPARDMAAQYRTVPHSHTGPPEDLAALVILPAQMFPTPKKFVQP
eukprot:362004-Chlamydomonas_euryale.AAC.16